MTTLNTPFGTPASTASSASSSVEVGVTSDGLATTVLPAARAGNSFQPSRPSGVFHGVMAATTPIGSRTVYVVKFGNGAPIVWPWSCSARPA